jgi:predicted ATPase/class 3 adenylate cyclase/DNA-binding CsgD family transcriptional regulator
MLGVGCRAKLSIVDAPTGVVTFLLTDVERSTQPFEQHAEVMAAAMRRHQEIIAETVTAHRGVRPDEQAEGDSSVAVFVRPLDAIGCALDIQRAMGAAGWPEGLELRVRAALHSGEAVLRDQRNYTGAAIHRCARVRALASGGQTLVSRSTWELAVDSLPDGAGLRDLGVHQLRDLGRPEQIYQLCHPDLQADFPPLRSVSAQPNNLPLQLTTFVGREGELAETRDLLRAHRLLTLTGAGGCGKTRLALHLGAEAVGDHPGGVWLAELAGLGDPDLVSDALMSALPFREVPGQPAIDALKAQIGDRELLIILDNCEHLLDACASMAAELLGGCPRVSLLATSREPLGVAGEVTWRVPSLSIPAADASAVAELSEAVQLFCDRGARARPSFRLTDDTAEAVAAICRRLDGIPLAIELAAARVRLLTPQQIAAGLRESFVLLTGGSRTALPRQRTLEASLDWSYVLLGEEEQSLFARLSVFPGSWDLDAVEEICQGDGLEPQQVFDTLASLVDKSLVQLEERPPKVRYRLLETVQAYARQRLKDANEARALRDRHLAHYLAVAERAEPELYGERMTMWMGPLDADLGNFRAALDWATDAGRVNESLRLSAALRVFWEATERSSEGQARLLAALAAEGLDVEVRMKALLDASHISEYVADWPAARAFAEDALALAEAARDELTVGRALAFQAWALAFIEPEPHAAREVFERALAILRVLDDGSFLADALCGAGFHEARAGQLVEARELLEEALSVARANANLLCVRESLTWLGHVEVLAGRLDRARTLLDEAVARSRELGDTWFECWALSGLGYGAALGGDHERAREHLLDAVRLAREGANPYLWLFRWYLALQDFIVGDISGAAARAAEELPLLERLGFPWAVSWTYVMLATAAGAAGKQDAARAHAEEAEALARRASNPLALGRALEARAAVAQADKELGLAEDLLHEALRALHEADDTATLADVVESLAGVAIDLESVEEAARLLGAAQALRERFDCPRFPVREKAYQAHVAAVRAALGEHDADTFRAEGQALSRDQAVAYAARGRGERKRPSSGWESLTPAEHHVVQLVAEGLTNPQIGERLFVSRRTVQTHLAHVFAKLGVATRSELTAQVVRRQQ